ncbi:hypothetical protein [Nocardioides deserti]|uniref:Uncharacterized protein n=1 Tax=Nocardioides deserti TaxID=1588644 RepID=A0ABR6U649_9ACTN|nr:hypothetical protein [Nocardioides deserti]MBC2959588.1 hypothetical protein [Nocardioides deserti]GGO73983.1 hypothetical protein GCM10012276_20900 [Nocardioides deserti]
MQESTVTMRPHARPAMHWVPVVDSRGRTRMEARWFDPGVASAGTTAARSAA